MAKKKKKKRKYTNSKDLELPSEYKAGFLKTLDGRTEVYQRLNTAFTEVMSDMGGVESLSHVQVCLAERFVFLEYVLHGIEHKIATRQKPSTKLLGKWVQGLNSLQGLAKIIGLKRHSRKVMNLKNYIDGDNDK